MADRPDTGDNDNGEFEAAEHPAADDTAAVGDTTEAADTADNWDTAATGTDEVNGYPGLDSLSVMHEDDVLLSALSAGEPDRTGDVGDQELNELLLAWRRDIDSEPMAELVDTDTAVAAVRTAASAGRRSHRARRQKAFVPVAVAAAVLMIAFTGTGLAARSAEPGDALWGLTQVLYTEHAQSVQAAVSARVGLDTADYALAHGRFGKAADALDAAAKAIRHVQPADQQQQLQVKHNKLTEKLPQQSGSTENSTTRGESTSAPTSTTGSTTTSSPQESSSAEPSESERSSKPTTTSRPEIPPSTSPRTSTPSSSTQRTGGEPGDETGGVSPKLGTSDQPQSEGPPPS